MQLDFIGLYDKYFDDVYRYVFFKTGSKWDTDDLVSEIFRKAYENFAKINSNQKAWLFTIARNTVADFYRKKREVAAGDDLDQLAYPGSFEDDLVKKDEMNCLKKSLNHLSKEELEIINLKYFSALKHAEIAALTGKTEDGVKMKSFRILNKLKVMVKRCVEG